MTEYFEFNGDQYVKSEGHRKTVPDIIGIPETWTYQKGRAWIDGYKTISWTAPRTKTIYKNPWNPFSKTRQVDAGVVRRSMKQPIVKAKHAPKSCNIIKLINWPFAELGGYQCAIVGTYGFGKSNLLNLMVAFHLAQNIRVLMFNDRRFEARHLADKGFYSKNLTFHPFEIDVMVPEGYEFSKGNPLWDHRKNVHKVEWSHYSQIIKAMKPHRLVVVYTECFDQNSVLKLWMDIMEHLANVITPNKNYIFAHHEFSTLIPETPTAEIAKTVREASEVALNLRKDKIGLITTFHMLSEVYYRISQKFTHVIYKRPVMRRNMSKAESDAQGFGRGRFNLSAGGRWMTHNIGMFSEVEDKYRMLPNRERITYPSLEPFGGKTQVTTEKVVADPMNMQILQLRAKGYSYAAIAGIVDRSIATVHKRAKNMEI